MIAVRTLILALVLVTSAAAQSLTTRNPSFRNMDFSGISPDALPSALSQPTYTASPPKSAKVFEKKFFGVMGSLGAAESLRFTTRTMVLAREYDAGAPWVTRPPSNQHTIVKGLGLYASEFLVAYETKKSHSWLPGDRVIRKLWWVYPAAMTVLHVKNAVGNIRTQGPAGCTSIACAMQMQAH